MDVFQTKHLKSLLNKVHLDWNATRSSIPT